MTLRSLRSFWRVLWHRDAFERDLDDELQGHLDARAEDLIKEGLSAGEAARRARLEFGNIESLQDRCRNERQLHLGDDFVADVRFALRSVARHRLLSATVVLTLAAGIGVSSGIFTLFDAAALRPHVPVDPPSFVQIFLGVTTDPTHPGRPGDASFDEYTLFRRAHTLRALAAHHRYVVSIGTERIPALLATCDFFDTLGTAQPLLGRLLQAQDCDAAVPVAVLDEALWRNRYNADLSIVGSPIDVNGSAVTVVGIAPNAAAQYDNARLWLPFTLRRYLNLGSPAKDERWLTLEGRLAPGVTRRQAAAVLTVLTAEQSEAGRTTVWVTDGAIVSDPRKPLVIPLIALVMGALSSLVLIACANIAVLLLSQADARQQEIAIRLSLGAGRARLLRMLLTETLVLAGASGAGSIWLAYQVPVLMFRWLVGGQPAYSLAPDWRAFTFLAATTILAGICAGLAPALESMRVDVLDSLKGRRSVLGGSGGTLRHTLVGVQVALCFVLLVGAGLFEMTHYRIATGDPGFEPTHLLIARGDAPPAVFERTFSGMPGVRSVAFARTGPVLTPASAEVSVDGGAFQWVEVNEVSPDYFRVVGIPVFRGRALKAGDTPCATARCHVVVSEAFARRLGRGVDPLGQVVRAGTVEMEIVGVVRDLSAEQIGQPDPPIVYEPWTPAAARYQAVVRFDGDPADFSLSATAALRRDLKETTADARTTRWYIDAWLAEVGALEWLILALGGSAAGLAVIGVFGVVSFDVSRRQREIGVRTALGARPSDIYVAVLRGGLKPVAAGLAAGVVLALGVAAGFTNVLDQMHFAVSSRDPSTYASAAGLLAAVILAATVVPASRAARIDPVAALRCE